MARKKKEMEMQPDPKIEDQEMQEEEPTEVELISEAEAYPGRVGPVGENQIREAITTFQKYKEAKSVTEQRVIDNYEWYKQRYATPENPNRGDGLTKPEEKSAWLFNSIINKHADAMDNIPTANILPREESDQASAEMLSKIVPVIMERRNFEKTYSHAWDDKLIGGGAIYKAFFDSTLDNGLGDINITRVDLLNLFWQPDIEDIQDSASVFHTEYVDNDAIKQQYPFMSDKLGSTGDGTLAEYVKENPSDAHDGQSLVYDWWYKKVNESGRTIIHLCRFCAGEVLWASENTEDFRERGYFDHGLYPFVFDTMFQLKGTPFGFGFVDVMKSSQYYIDKLDEVVLKNAMMAGKVRFLKKKQCNVDINQFADWNNDFVDVDGGMIDDSNIRQIQVNSLPPFIINHWNNKINELKETSGNRDFSQGATTSGVTSGTAIASLQEAGSKLARDMIKTTYNAYSEIINMVVELIRQFYTEDRYFRIDQPNGMYEFVQFNNAQIQDIQTTDPITQEISVRRPYFDYKVSAQKMSPFAREAQNSTAKELFQMGVFNPAVADQVMPMLEMMQFEGIDKVKKYVAENGQMYNQLLQMTKLAGDMATTLADATGDPTALNQVMSVAGQGNPAAGGMGGEIKSTPKDTNGMPVNDNTQASKARVAAANRSTPK